MHPYKKIRRMLLPSLIAAFVAFLPALTFATDLTGQLKTKS